MIAWLKGHFWRIVMAFNLVIAFVSNYKGDSINERMASAVIGALAMWGFMCIGEFASREGEKNDNI